MKGKYRHLVHVHVQCDQFCNYLVCYYRFASVAKEVLAERIPSKAYDTYMIACALTKMLYSARLRNLGGINLIFQG